QLVEAQSGTHLWANRFDGSVEDIFALQDEVTSRVVGAIAPNVRDAEIERARRKPTSNLTAYDYYLRALYFMHRGSKADSEEALALIGSALQLDPTFSLAAALGAMLHQRRLAYGWVSIADGAAAAKTLLELAVEHANDDPDI